MTQYIDAAKALLAQAYGITGELRALPGEIDLNYQVLVEGQAKYILKIASPQTSQDFWEFQHALIQHLSQRLDELNFPQVVPTLSGKPLVHMKIEGASHRMVRLLTWIPGKVWAQFSPHSPELLRSLGQVCGKLSKVLQEFDHPAAHAQLKWDPQHAGWVEPHIEPLFKERPEEKQILENCLELFHTHVQPIGGKLRKSVNHNDANDYNILVADNQVQCLVDYGDAVYSYTVNELAIAIAYAAMDKPDPLTAACEVLAGYHPVFPLSEYECQALFPLVLARLMISVVCSAQNRADHPENSYLQISERAAWAVLKKWDQVSPNFAHYRFREVCGYEPVPQKTAFDQWVAKHAPIFVPVCPGLEEGILLDLSVGSRSLGNYTEYGHAEKFGYTLQHMLTENGKKTGMGGYGEFRPVYTTDAYTVHGNNGPQWRSLHLGTDIWQQVGSPVFAPIEGTIEAIQYNDGDLDYGFTIILKHSPREIPPFYTLYGHLGKEIVDTWVPGMRVKAGSKLGEMGRPKENGNWPPHLHFQVILDLLGNHGDFPGVAFPHEAQTWLSLCPDPAPFLGIEMDRRGLTKRNAPESGSMVEKRKKILGKSLSISYDKPLHMVRGQGQYLIDIQGRRYLDLVNNVAHVGHEHPEVVAAGQRQMALLNTNSRYLHADIIAYAEELLATLPPELCVCHFVNSGSEANELALRMAKVYTGQKDMLAIQIGYHGNTGACIEVSSYKFDGKGGKGAPEHTHVLPLPDTYRGLYRDPVDAGHYYAAYVGEWISAVRQKGRGVAGFIGESIMSCGGQVVLPQDYLADVYHQVRNAGGLCIADEVQVGFGRVGKHFWGFELQGVVPDIVTMGKPIGNGHPLAAVVCTREVADTFANGMEYFSTFGGNPVSCAIGRAVLKTIQTEGMQENARKRGAYFKAGLQSLQEQFPLIGEVRGEGLFLGFELVQDLQEKNPAAQQARYLANRMRERGILISTDGPDYNVLKIKPPMCIHQQDIDFVLDTLNQVLKEDALKI